MYNKDDAARLLHLIADEIAQGKYVGMAIMAFDDDSRGYTAWSYFGKHVGCRLPACTFYPEWYSYAMHSLLRHIHACAEGRVKGPQGPLPWERSQ